MPEDFAYPPHPADMMQLAGDGFTGDELCRQYRLGDQLSWVTIQGTAKDGSEKKTRALLMSAHIPASSCEYFNPLEEHGLIFQFASVEPTEANFLEFAQRFGFLGVRPIHLVEPAPSVGELWDDWKEAHSDLARAVGVWNDLQAGGDGYEKPPNGTVLVGLGKESLLQEINSHLRGATTMRVVWHIGRQAHEIRVVPTTLLGALWWQLARLFVGEVTYGRCETCRRYMERGPRDGGSAPRMSNAVFCSSSCRNRDHRSKVKAIHLQTTGMPLECIAGELDTDIKTVTRWLTKKQ